MDISNPNRQVVSTCIQRNTHHLATDQTPHLDIEMSRMASECSENRLQEHPF